ncbi:MAG: transposase, partial [Gemmiger sp.]|nr:transposase [Gemmiger sp.]
MYSKIKKTAPLPKGSGAVQTVEKVQHLLGFFIYVWYNKENVAEKVKVMLETGQMNRDSVEMVNIDMLVPEGHLLRKIDVAIDFTKIYEFVKDLYSEDTGRPSVDPVVLFKIVLIQHIYGIPSLRRT